jgi:WYL domain
VTTSTGPTTAQGGSTAKDQVRGYQGRTRLIEPYAVRRSRAGNRLVYAIEAESDEVRTCRVDRIEGVQVTNLGFDPHYAIELSAALPVATGRRGPRPGARRPRRL